MTESILMAIVSMLLAFYATSVVYSSGYTKATIIYVDDIVAFTDKGHHIYAPKDIMVGDTVLVGQMGDYPYIVKKVKPLRKGETE